MEVARILGTSLRGSFVGLGTRAARSWMWGQESCRCSVQSFLSALTSQAFLDNVHSPCRVEVPVTRHLPHRSHRAAFPQWALVESQTRPWVWTPRSAGAPLL